MVTLLEFWNPWTCFVSNTVMFTLHKSCRLSVEMDFLLRKKRCGSLWAIAILYLFLPDKPSLRNIVSFPTWWDLSIAKNTYRDSWYVSQKNETLASHKCYCYAWIYNLLLSLSVWNIIIVIFLPYFIAAHCYRCRHQYKFSSSMAKALKSLLECSFGRLLGFSS
jgi:hypothetical protein